jgi:DNA repair exonuclease SbcCD ATPase subunit
MNQDNNRTINGEEDFAGGTEETGTFLDQNTSGAPFETTIHAEEEDEEEYDDANTEEEISNSIGESVVVVQEGGDSSSSNWSVPEYFQSSINSSKLQVPAGVAPEEVKRMVDAAVKKAREEAMVELQIQLQMATKQATKDLKEAKKDIKKLRKNVHDLSAELEAAEQEMAAQRAELERAGQRMERDRIRHKEEIDRKEKDNQDTISTITSEHKAAIKSMAAAHAEQVNEMQERLQRNEEARAKEGGDWQGELEQAVQHEQESLKKVIALEDEKSTLLSQISTLQTTISSLQLRCDSLTITANTFPLTHHW